MSNPDIGDAVFHATAALASCQKQEWTLLVALAYAPGGSDHQELAKKVAAQGNKAEDSVVRSLTVIAWLAAKGWARHEIEYAGSRRCFAAYREGTKAKDAETKISMKFVVPMSLREAFLDLLDRIGSVCEIETREGQLDYIVAAFADAEDQELLHLAGESKKAGQK